MIKLIKRLFKPKVDFVKLIKQGALVVDVRTKSEYASGHIDGSKNIPLDKIQTEIKTLKQLNRPIVTVCRSGTRSGLAKSILTSAGLEAYNGGAWTNLKKLI
ncbi:MAG TPA: rhodanese-like domain-containing protein [Chitinophagaceae bacterium]|nr:rhodanese-like domain-containing protein [Chitinophagaceae bacterium]